VNSRIGERFDHPDVSYAADTASAERQSDLLGTKDLRRMIHQVGLYNSGSADGGRANEALHRLQQIEELIRRSGHTPQRAVTDPGRNLLTRTVDAALAAARHYAPPVHWLGVAIVAAGLFIYAHLMALTVRLTTVGERSWPHLPAPCVLAMWHGCVNSWIVAMVKRRSEYPLAIMIARNPRGDCLALLCRWLGLRVVRGESGERGWEALAELALDISRGACAVITTDGGGPALIAKAGAVALASATGATLVTVGADCRPAIYERHKWDRGRIPLPFGRVAVALGPSRQLPVFTDFASIEQARSWLQESLDEVTAAARL
jgi:lysophospholipid acyltransferase (LPLAT)-like uncharacterized protein